MTDALPCMCTALRKASRAVSRRYDEHLADSGMTITQFALLRNIGREREIHLSRLADKLVMERTTLYRSLAPLERQGWVLVVTPGKGRAKTASLTDAGRAAMELAVPAWETAQAEVAKAVDVLDLRALTAQLRQLVALSGGNAS